MKALTGFAIALMTLTVSLASISPSSQASSKQIVDRQSTAARPVIKGIQLDGKRLIVTGEGFADGAVIFVNDTEERTKKVHGFPGTLVAKKAGKRLALHTTSVVVVVNPDESESQFEYVYADEELFARQVLPIILPPFSTISMSVGDYLLVNFGASSAGVHFFVDLDSSFFTRVINSKFASDDLQLFRAEQAGSANVRIEVRFDEPAPFQRDLLVVIE